MATLSDLARIDAAINSGALEVRFQDRLVKYQSTESMLMARAKIYNELYPSARRQTRIYTGKGW